MTRNGEILMLGDINIDTVWPVDKLPGPGRDAYVDKVSASLGGAILNTAIVLDKLGHPAAMLSCMGDDIWSRQIREMLGQTDISLAYTCVKPEYASGLVFITVTPDGERTMISQRGANIQFGPRDLDETAFKEAAALHISGYSLLESPQKEASWRAVEMAKQYGVPISLDSGFEPVFIDPDSLLQLIPDLAICVTGPKEMEKLYGLSDPEEAADHLISMGVKLAAIKLGEKGCIVADQNEKCFCPAFKVDVLDTTGAGDSFSAGLLFGWTHGLSLQASVVLASALGALATTRNGAGLGLPGRIEVLEFLTNRMPGIPAELRVGVSEAIQMLGNPD